MGAEERVVRLERNGDGFDTKVFDCPKCGTHLQFNLEIGVRRIKVAQTAPAGWSKRVDSLTVPERQVVEECRATGLLGAFMAAFNASNLAGKPSNPEKFFVRFLALAGKKKTPQFAVRLCLPEGERAGHLELWTHGLISAVIADGEFRQFVPTELVNGEKTSNLTPEGGWLQTGEKIDLNGWVKTRFGYVVSRGLLFHELRRRCVGDFQVK